jgi:16S rRNA (cytosine967-C5)-methyltransferase
LADRLIADLGATDAAAALGAMNEPASATERDDGYVQDQASQWVAGLVGAQPGERVVDLCAAPGGKATALAGTVVAADHTLKRIGLVRSNATQLDRPLHLVVADAGAPAFRPASFDRVLLDAPCSGLGTLRRRADARWRIDADGVIRLADLQRRLLAAAATLVRPGGTLVYSVCTLTVAEGPDVAATLPWPALPPPDEPWRPWGSGAVLLPQTAGTDGMFLARWQAP